MDKRKSGPNPTSYQIKVKGHLGCQWSEWFDGATITLQGPNTSITGKVTDQSALYGLLNRVHDLGLPLISIKCG